MPKKSRHIRDEEYIATLKGINKVINYLMFFVGILLVICMIAILVFGG